MNLFRSLTIYLLVFQSFLSFSQVTLTGRILNDKGEKLSFVNIGIKGKNVGACTSEEGNFSINIPQNFVNDTLRFALLGYQDHKAPIAQLISSEKKEIILKQKPVYLKEVSVTAKKLVERKFGITKYNPLFHLIDASVEQNDVFEIAQVIHLPSALSKLTSLDLMINENRKDSGLFRINFYAISEGRPSEKLNKKEILQKKAIREGWLRFDLKNEGLYFKGDVVAAIEFIPSAKGVIKYEVKVGGSSSSFVRTSSFGEWIVPPHHYRLFATALVEDGRSKAVDDDEKETVPTMIMHSKNVKDSMYIFVSVPKSYSQTKKKYPVVYLLDANVYFDLLKKDQENIIVGIGYKNVFLADSLRDRDYTYPMAKSSDTLSGSGDGILFLNFIENELIPFIDKNYRIDSTDRTLMGHSLGGYFTLFAMSYHWKEADPFKTYIAASPSLDYCNNYLIEQFRSLKEFQTMPKHLLVTSGSEEGLKEAPILCDILKHTSVDLKCHEFPKMQHMETAVISFKNALSYKKNHKK